MQTPKIVLDQIDRATNPNRDLGLVKLNQPVVLNYKDKEDVSDIDNVELKWKKRYYSYNRGEYFPLDLDSFNNFFGKIYRTEVNGQYGNFVDVFPESHSNVHYSVDVYVTQETSIRFSVELSNGSVSIYNNQVSVYQSSVDNFYISAQHNIYLKTGWNTIDVLAYHKDNNGELKINADLARKISSWRSVDFTPPNPPEWYSTPLQTEYVDPQVGPQLQNVIRFKNSKYQRKYEDVRGWGIYRYVTDLMIDASGSSLIIVSGWSNNAFTVSGDVREQFPSQMYVGPGFATYIQVSGTQLLLNENQTLVIVSGTGYDFDIFSGNSIGRKYYKHITDIEWDTSLGSVVSGIDNQDIIHGRTYEYALDTYDGSSNQNRSEKSSTQSFICGDFTPPPKLQGADFLITTGSLKTIKTTIKNPERWASPPTPNDVRGYRIWSTANPTSPYDNYLIGDYPISVSGTNTTIEINQYMDGTTLTPLEDKTSYTFYVSSYDWLGNEFLTSLPSVTASTSVYIRTGPADTKVVIDSSTNSIHFYVDTADAV